MTNGYDRACIIEALKNIPQDQRAYVCKQALKLYDGVTVGCDRVIYALIKIPQDQRADVAQHALTLSDCVTYGFDRARIIEALKAIPQDQRANFEAQALTRMPFQAPLILLAYWHSKENHPKWVDYLSAIVFLPTIIYFVSI